VFSMFRRRRERRAAAQQAYVAIVERAREPYFYRGWRVPDTLDGRYELLALHAFLVLNRLKRDRAVSRAFAQSLFDIMFADLDRGVREMGATDIGVGRHVKRMARGFYGRIAAYDKGMADESEMAAALRRNLFGTVPEPGDADIAAVRHYIRRQAAALDAAPLDRFLAGEAPFAPLVG